MDSDTALSASSFSALYQFQGRIAPTTNKSWHCPFPESAVAPLDLRWKDYEMRKGFTRKPKADEPATQGKNYITPSGLQRLQDEHRFLLTRERPAVKDQRKGLPGRMMGRTHSKNCEGSRGRRDRPRRAASFRRHQTPERTE